MDPAAAFYEEDAKDLDFYDFEPLPTLPEDEENVSLADILSLRDGGLSEQEAWAVCLECSLALRSVAPAAIFQTLCITPDTLAFHSSGSVCFMEQLSDDPEGAFVPPEFDDTGNTFEAHIYSLGATLKAALEYPAGPEPGPRLSGDLEALLSQMQAEDPGDRPELQSVIALCEQKVPLASSCRLCRTLSAAGRRVLSIESFGAFQDVSESAWRGRPRRQPGDPGNPPSTWAPTCPEPAETTPAKPLLSTPVRNGESHGLGELASLLLDTPHHRGDLEPLFLERGHLRKVQTYPRLLPEGPEASGLCLTLTSTKNLLPALEPPTTDTQKGPPKGRRGFSGVKAPPLPTQQPEPQRDGTPGASQPGQGPAGGGPPAHSQDAREEGMLDAAAEQGVSLQDLLRQLGRPFRDYELWALAHACLSALRAQRQHPAYLCPDSVLVAEDGAVHLAPPPAHGAPDSFFLAPEAAEQKSVTEKASVYCVAAVLWTAAKFSVPQDHKLALPRRLKTLLLDMARRRAPERPSAAEALKACSAYLLQRGMDSGKILAHLRASTCQADQEEETISLQKACPGAGQSPRVAAAPQPRSGFRGDAQVLAVQGPGPSQCPRLEGAPQPLPEPAAAHFRPVQLPPPGAARAQLAVAPGPASAQPAPATEPPEASAWTEPDSRACVDGAPAPPAARAQEPPRGQGPGRGAPLGASAGGLGVLALRSAATPDPGPPAEPPPEPWGPRPAPGGPAPAAAGPESPRGAPAQERGGQAPDGSPERPRPADSTSCPSSVDAARPPGSGPCPSLQEATRLIREEFAFDGYLDNGLEALIMGEHILGLRDLTFATFCGAVSDKFSDLYWGEKLLCDLFAAVNGGGPAPEGAPAEAAPWREDGGWTGQSSSGSPASRRASLRGAGKEMVPVAGGSRAPCPAPARVDADTEEPSGGSLEVGFRPQRPLRAGREQQGAVAEAPQQASPDSEAAARPAWRAEGSPAGAPSGSPGWGSAFYEEACFGADVHRYAQQLAGQQALDADAHSPELEQQLVMEERNYRKTLRFYQKLSQKGKRSKGSEVKAMLSKLKGQLEEAQCKVQLLRLVRKYLQVLYAERWGLEPCALPDIVNMAAAPSDTLAFSPLDESSSLIFYNVSKQARGGRQRKGRVLQAGTPLGLMAYLYSSDAFLEGYVQQFLYTFRYFCTPQDFLHFLLDRISGALARAPQDPTSTKIYKRSLCVLQAWLEACLSVDFTHDAGLLHRLQHFLATKILPLDGAAEHLLGLLEAGAAQPAGAPCGAALEDPRAEEAGPLGALCKRLSEDGISRKSLPWRLSRRAGPAPPPARERRYSIAAALPRPCFLEDAQGPPPGAGERGPCVLTDYSAHQLFTQLTLLQQELFQKCHPVHFLNSRALGVVDRSAALPRPCAAAPPVAPGGSLFPPSCGQDGYLLQLLHSADDISTWVAAEVVSSPSAKLQADLLAKLLLTAKSCYEHRNFATAMQILGGLEHPAVRQAPAWRILPAKMAEIMEELKAVEVFLKSDSLCLMEGQRSRPLPTLPSARLLAMHVQQLETGGFTMTNGAHRWSKLRSIARVVSQVAAFQERPFAFPADARLQAHLRRRVARFSGADVAALAGSRPGPPGGGGARPARRIQDALRRVRATFQ